MPLASAHPRNFLAPRVNQWWCFGSAVPLPPRLSGKHHLRADGVYRYSSFVTPSENLEERLGST